MYRCKHKLNIDTKWVYVHAVFLLRRPIKHIIVIHTVCKMVGKRSVKAAEIRGYIKTRVLLGYSVKEIFNDLCAVHGHNEVSYTTVSRWVKKFKSGYDSINDAPKCGRLRSVTSKNMVEKVHEIVKSDARLTIEQISKSVGMSAASVFRILKRDLKMRRIAARWIPHLLTEEQKRVRLETAKKLLKLYPKYDKKKFSDLITGDETWVHFFEPTRKVSNKIWATKNCRRPTIAKRILSVKKAMFVIFFDIRGHVVQVIVPRKKSVTGLFYKQKVLKKLKRKCLKRRPRTGIKHLSLLHDNAPAHRSEIVTSFLKKEGVRVIPHPPYSPDLAPCDYFLFPRLKKYLSGRHFRSRQALGSAVYQYMLSIPKHTYENCFKNWIKRLKLCVRVKGDYFEGILRK